MDLLMDYQVSFSLEFSGATWVFAGEVVDVGVTFDVVVQGVLASQELPANIALEFRVLRVEFHVGV